MLSTGNFETHARRLAESDKNPIVRLQLATEIRDSIEIVHTSEYGNFLKAFFPVFYRALFTGKPQFIADSPEQKIRNVLLEILNRLPHNEVLRPFVSELMKLSMNILEHDNEDNAVICLRIIFDLHKNFRPSLHQEVQPFLEFVKKTYSSFPSTLQIHFAQDRVAPNVSSSGLDSGMGGDLGGPGSFQFGPSTQSGSQNLTRSTESFKVLTECPLIVMFLFQLYPQYIQQNIPQLLPLMVNAIGRSPPSYVTPSNPVYRQAFADLVAAQVKTVSFLTYLLRGFGDFMRAHQEHVPRAVVQLLLACPPESVAIRKELLVATRHIIATEFRQGFFSQIDTLLDEKVLIGNGRPSSSEILRPLAHSLLAELIHYFRLELTLHQLSKIVYLFSRNVHDASLAVVIQNTSVKLLLNLVESILNLNRADNNPESKASARQLLVRILDCFVNKICTLKHYIPKLVKTVNASASSSAGTSAAQSSSSAAAADAETKPTIIDGVLATPAAAGAAASSSSVDASTHTDHVKEVNDCKQIMKTLLVGLKTVIWSISNLTQIRSPVPAMTPGVPGAPPVPMTIKGLSEDECAIVTRLLKSGLKCFLLYSAVPNSSQNEEKEILELFAGVFTVLDARNFQEIVAPKLEILLKHTMDNPAMLTIAQHFLANQTVSKHFADILLSFLVSRIKLVGSADNATSTVLLRLFKILFASITLFPENEMVLRPHVPTIVTECLSYASSSKDPVHFLSLLRSLFKSIGGGKFMLLYDDFPPMLPALLDSLLRLLNGPHKLAIKDVCLELCLTVPAKISSLVPHLSQLMQPVVMALQSTPELVSVSLRSLEFWVDNLNADYLESTVLAKTMPELMLALWKHMKPAPYAFGPSAQRILGKLGGRNRRFMKQALHAEMADNLEQGLRLALTFGDSQCIVPLDQTVRMATASLSAPGTPLHYKQQVLVFLRICAAALLRPLANLSPGMPVHMNLDALELSAEGYAQTDSGVAQPNEAFELLNSGAFFKNKSQLVAEREVMVEVIVGVFIAAADTELKDPAVPLADDIARFFAVVLLSRPSLAPPKELNLTELDPMLFLDALVRGMCSERRECAISAARSLEVFVDAVTSIADNRLLSARALLMSELAHRFCHCCYQPEWYHKNAACLGLNILLSKLDVAWIRASQLQFVHALLFVLKDIPQDVFIHAGEEAMTIIIQIIKVSNQQAEDPAGAGQRTDLVALLASELSNPNPAVRKHVQNSLQLLAEQTGNEITEVLEVIKPGLMQALFEKNGQTLSPAAQMGNMDAVTFCLLLRPPLLPVCPQLMSLLLDALAIAEQAEIHSPLTSRATQQHTALRTTAMELMVAAIGCSDFRSTEHDEIRRRIIAVFFKSLTYRAESVIDVAKKGLAQVIAQQKLPKDLLQGSLRPVLVNLADYRKLNLPLLNGLARLLELLSNWFNVTLGEKLLEHLRRWTEPEKISQQKIWRQGEECKIAAAIIELFHLLPSVASKFLEPLLSITMQLESLLPRMGTSGEICNPYREPITKYLNRYASESVDFFLSRGVQDPAMARFFQAIVRSDKGNPLREQLAHRPDKLIQSCFAPRVAMPGMQSFDVQLQGLVLIRTLVKFMPDWLPNNHLIFSHLEALWVSPQRLQRVQNEEHVSIEQVRESKIMIKCFLNYAQAHPEEVNVLFHLLSVFTTRTLTDYSFLKHFYTHTVSENYTPAQKKLVLSRFVHVFKEKSVSNDVKVVALQVLIIPMLSASFQKNEGHETVDSDMIRSIVTELLDPPDNLIHTYDEQLRSELLQLATLLIRHMPQELVQHRKELIKFGWNHLKREDTTSKQWAFVNVCRFFEAYQAPDKIILQVYVALLRACQQEARPLVKQALDILTPALPKRLPPGDHKYPIWIRYTKKILVEEGHSMPHLIHIWQLLVRHSHLFYPSRAQFVPQMVNSLNRLGTPPNCPPENRKLAIDLAELIIMWEQQRISAQQGKLDTKPPALPDHFTNGTPDLPGISSQHLGDSADPLSPPQAGAQNEDSRKRALGDMDGAAANDAKRPKLEAAVVKTEPKAEQPGTPNDSAAGGSGAAGTSGSADDEFKPNGAMIEMVVLFLMRVAFLTNDNREGSSKLTQAAVSLLGKALTVWPEANVKFNFMEKVVTANAAAASGAANAAGAAAGAGGAASASGGTGSTPDVTPNLHTALEITNTVVEHQPHTFVTTGLQQIQGILKPCYASPDANILAALSTLISKLLASFPMNMVSASPNFADLQHFYHDLTTAIDNAILVAATQGLNAAPAAAHPTVDKPPSLNTALVLLKRIMQFHPEYLDRFVPNLLKVFTRLTKDHLAALLTKPPAPAVPNPPPAPASNGPKPATPTPSDAANPSTSTVSDPVASALILCIHLLGKRILAISDILQPGAPPVPAQPGAAAQHRKQFVQVMNSLLEKTTEVDILMEITDLLGTWICSKEGTINAKDKISFLQKLAVLDRVPNCGRLQKAFLDIVYRLYCEAPSPAQRDILNKIERAFIVGLRSDDPAIRSRFYDIYGSVVLKPLSLYQRVLYVLDQHDWEPVADTFWLKYALDLLLTALNPSDTIKVDPLTARLPLLPLSPPSDSVLPTQPQPPILESVPRFLLDLSNLRLGTLVEALRELCVNQPTLAANVWTLVFPRLWSCLSPLEQSNLQRPLVQLLGKDMHNKQKGMRPNVIQVMLESLNLCEPQPKLPPEVVKFLGKTFNVWHVAVPMLESAVIAGNFQEEKSCDALCDLYKILNLDDMTCGLWFRRSSFDETRAGLALEQHGMWQRGQEMFLGMINASLASSKSEMALWEERMIQCGRQLSQYEMLDYASTINNTDLLAECLWKVPKWLELTELLNKSPWQDTPQSKVYLTYVALQEGKLHDAEQHCSQGMQLTLSKWHCLPELPCSAHVPLLQLAQQLVELSESAQIVLEINNLARHPQLQELREVVRTWKDRLPNKWDDMTTWNDILVWREHMFTFIGNAALALQQAASHDLANIGYMHLSAARNTMAEVARRHQLIELCLRIVGQPIDLPIPSTDESTTITEGLGRLRTQAKCIMACGNLEMLKKGLEIFQKDTPELEKVSQEQKAEIFEIKAELLRCCGYAEQANVAYSNALSTFNTFARGWVSWGAFCDARYVESQQAMWAEYAVNCYLQGIRYAPQKRSALLSRVIILIGCDDDATQGAVGRAFEKYADLVPPWTFLPWVPQLLASLVLAEAPKVKTVLARLVAQFPQAVFYPLRAYVLERAPYPNPPSPSISSPSQQMLGLPGSSRISNLYAEELLAAFTSSHGPIYADLETLCNHIVDTIQPHPLEALLPALHAILWKCYQTPPRSAEVPRLILQELESMCRNSFATDPSSTPLAIRHNSFVSEFKGAAEADLSPSTSGNFPTKVIEVIQRLQAWRALVQQRVDALPTELNLENLDPSRFLLRLPSAEVEVPGQYFEEKEQTPEQHLRLERLDADIHVIRSSTRTTYHRIVFHGSDGRQYPHILQTSLSSAVRSSDERLLHLYRLINRLLDHYIDTRKRNLSLYAPNTIPLSNTARLLHHQDNSSYVSLADIYSAHCASYGREPDAPIVAMRETLSYADLTEPAAFQARRQLYSQICEQQVPDTILTQYMVRSCTNPSQILSLRSQFTSHLALASILGFAIGITGRPLDKLSFVRTTGEILHPDVFPFYVPHTPGMDFRDRDIVPFRLSPNLATFVTPFGVEGPLSASMFATANCLVRPKQQASLVHFLSVFLRDEMLPWRLQQENVPSLSPASAADLRMNITRTVSIIVNRLQSLSCTAPSPDQMQAVNARVVELISQAMNPQNLCQMDPTWHPWF